MGASKIEAPTDHFRFSSWLDSSSTREDQDQPYCSEYPDKKESEED